MAETSTGKAATPGPIQDRLSGKVALITGGGGAIGLATGVRFVLEGARVALVDLSADTLAAAKEQISASLPVSRNLEDVLFAVQCDVTNDADVEKCVAQVAGKWGRVDCAFLNVGISYASKSLLETTEDEYERVMRVNVKSVPSVLAAELGQHGIRVNTIHPSGVNTPMFRLAWSEEKIEELKRGVPLGRVAEVEDVSGVVSWLASEDAKFVSGAMIKIDGGSVSF